MASYVNSGSININGNFQTISKLDTFHASTNITVDNTGSDYSTTWNGNASNTDKGVICFLGSIDNNASATTLTVALEEDTGGGSWVSRASTTLVYNQTAMDYPSYIYFEFSSTHTETAGTNNYRYKFDSNGNSVNQIFLRANSASTTNVGCVQVLNATGTPGAGDNIYVMGYCTGATNDPTAATVTVNGNYNGTAFGNIIIGMQGTLAFGTSASTTYYLEVAEDIDIYPGGAMTVGTTGTPIPSTSTATVEMNTTAADREIKTYAATTTTGVSGILTLQGADKFTTDTYFHTTLASQANSGQANIVCAIDVQAAGWAANDEIIVAATGNTLAQTESMTIQSVSTTTITCTGNLSNTHKAGGHIMNITRNVVITQSGSNWTSIDLNNTAGVAPVCNFDWVQFKDLISTAGAEYIIVETAGSALQIDNCTFDDCGGTTAGYGALIYTTDAAGYTRRTFTNIGIYSPTKLSYSFYIISGEIDFTHVCSLMCGQYVFQLAGQGQNCVIRNCVCVDRLSSTSDYHVFQIADYGTKAWMYDCMFAGMKDSGGAGGACYYNGTYSGNKLYAYNCYFGNDGTNDFDCTVDVVMSTTGQNCEAFLYNCNLKSTATVSLGSAPYNPISGNVVVHEQNVNMTNNRHKTTDYYGVISDQITGGQAEAWARGGSGLCVYISPNSTTTPLWWDFYVPVTASVAFQVSMYVKTTQTSSGPSMTCTIYDSDDDATVLLNAESVSLTADWAQYLSTLKTPSTTGFCRVRMACLDGSSTGDIGVDDVTVV